MTIVDSASQNIDQLFDDPWFTGGPLESTLVPGFAQVAIAGHPYIIEPSKYQRITVPLQRQSTDESVEPGEQTLNVAGAWRRSQDNWFMGSDQLYLDNRFAFVSVYVHSGEDPSIRTRFWRSKGVNPWTEGELSLLPLQELKSTGGTGLLTETVGPYLYMWDGTNLKYTANPSVAVPIWTTVAPPAGSGSWPTVLSMETDGANLYLALGSSGLAKTTQGSGSSSYMRPTPAAPAVSVQGTPGSTSYTYAIVATDVNGYKSFVSPFTTISNGAATLTTGNYNQITWTEVPGAISYDVLRQDSAHAIALGITGQSFTDNGTVQAPYSNGSLVAYTAPTATTENFQATFVSYGNSFLIAGAGPTLCQIDANGFTTLIFTHYNPSFVWNAGGGSEVAIYAAGYAGNVSELYGIQLSTSTFGLGAPFIAGQVGDGEIINDIVYYQGIVVLCTSLGVRAAQDAQSNGFLTTGAVSVSLGGSKCAAPYGAYVWFGISNYSESDGIWPGTNESSGTGRLFLSEFSNPLIPAYATDVLALDGVTGQVNSVTIWNGAPYFTVEGSGLWGPESLGYVVEQGFLESGWVRYGTVEDKILVSVDVRHDPLEGQVEIQVVPFGGTIFSTPPSAQQGSTGPPESINAGNRVGEAFQIIPVLTRSTTDATKGPVLRRWTCRSMIVAVRQDQIVVPIIWKDREKTPMGDGQPFFLDLEAEWAYLQGLLVQGGPFIYQEGALSYTCYVDQIELDGEKWNDQKTMLEGILSVKLLTVN